MYENYVHGCPPSVILSVHWRYPYAILTLERGWWQDQNWHDELPPPTTMIDADATTPTRQSRQADHGFPAGLLRECASTDHHRTLIYTQGTNLIISIAKTPRYLVHLTSRVRGCFKLSAG